MPNKVFLKAEWNNLLMANYEVSPQLLSALVPKQTELDFFEDKCYVSLVAFMFNNTKVLGLKIPFHVNFEEINLRFYVKRKINNENERGVVFIKEIVSKPAITFVANVLYNENYDTMHTAHEFSKVDGNKKIAYKWGRKQNNLNEFSFVTSGKKSSLIPGSMEEFITEHYWGYAANGDETTEYEVAHPQWNILEHKEHFINCNFASVYGKEWEFLNTQKPSSVFMAEGSEIIVYKGKTI